MKVNFDNMRLNLAEDYNNLIRILQSGFCDGNYEVDKDDLTSAIISLHNSLAGILALYDEDGDYSVVDFRLLPLEDDWV